MTLTQLTNDLINYYRDYDPYDFRNSESPTMFDELYKGLFNEDRRQTIIECLKECAEESSDINEINGAVKLINELEKICK